MHDAALKHRPKGYLTFLKMYFSPVVPIFILNKIHILVSQKYIRDLDHAKVINMFLLEVMEAETHFSRILYFMTCISATLYNLMYWHKIYSHYLL